MGSTGEGHNNEGTKLSSSVRASCTDTLFLGLYDLRLTRTIIVVELPMPLRSISLLQGYIFGLHAAIPAYTLMINLRQ
ncbi:hypothetical protein BDV10DRAFT_151328 [Aspergillus recurvatus]